MINFNKIKNRIGELRNVYYSDPMLAKDLKVTQRTITNWKKGKTHPNLKHLLKIKELGSFESLDQIVS